MRFLVHFAAVVTTVLLLFLLHYKCLNKIARGSYDQCAQWMVSESKRFHFSMSWLFKGFHIAGNVLQEHNFEKCIEKDFTFFALTSAKLIDHAHL